MVWRWFLVQDTSEKKVHFDRFKHPFIGVPKLERCQHHPFQQTVSSAKVKTMSNWLLPFWQAVQQFQLGADVTQQLEPIRDENAKFSWTGPRWGQEVLILVFSPFAPTITITITTTTITQALTAPCFSQSLALSFFCHTPVMHRQLWETPLTLIFCCNFLPI